MATDTDILDKIPDAKPVRVFLPLKNMHERYRMQGVFQKSVSPGFSLLFKTGALPVDSINTDEACIISIDMGGPTISLEANIKQITSDQQLDMSLVKAMSHEQMREFFRVDAVTSVIGRSFPSSVRALKAMGQEEWFLSGETVDISGSGILAVFAEKPPNDNQISLEITLPTIEKEVIKVTARPVRTVATEDDHFEVAYHFEEISTEDRDKIIGCCLEIQRRLLRLKVKVKDL